MTNQNLYEYSCPTELKDEEAIYIMVPDSLFWTDEANWHLVAVFAYFSLKRGLDQCVLFSVNHIVKWLNKQPNRNPTGINSKIIECINYLDAQNFISIKNPLDNASLNEAIFNINQVKKECDRHTFAILYLDELRKILKYQKPDEENDCHVGYEILLNVFLYFKFRIFKRPNKLRAEEIGRGGGGSGDIERRRTDSPEAFDAYYRQIGEDLGLSSRVVSAATKILSQLQLIYVEELPRYKFEGEWRTDHSIFSLVYKREKNKLLASGESYYEAEIANKIKKLTRYRRSEIV